MPYSLQKSRHVTIIKMQFDVFDVFEVALCLDLIEIIEMQTGRGGGMTCNRDPQLETNC